MKLVIIRERDAATFELAAQPYGPFYLDASAKIPGGSNLDVTGFEYSGKDGGYQTASRLQRRPFTAPFVIREDRTTTLGLFELIRQAQGFFIPHQDDLSVNFFTVEVHTNDRVQSVFQMRHGTISASFNAEADVGEFRAKAQVSFIFGDPYLYPVGDSGTTLRLFAGGQSLSLNGRKWDVTNGAMWDATKGKLWQNAGGSGDPVAVSIVSLATVPVSVVSAGTLVNPEIVNLTNDSSFTYNGTLGSGDVLTIDTNGVVLVNGTAPPFTYSGVLTATNGVNTFAMIAAGGSPGHVDLTILGAF